MRRAGFLTNAIMSILIIVLSCTLLYTMFSFRADQRKRTEELREEAERVRQEKETAMEKAMKEAQEEEQRAEEEAAAQLPIEISCRGESWAKDGNDRDDGWPAMLNGLFEENEDNAVASDYTWDMSGSLSQMRFADVPEATVNDYIKKHNDKGLQGIRVETTVRDDLDDDYIEREDLESIPVICIGYNGGYGRSTDELIEQQEVILKTYVLTDGSDDSDVDKNNREYDDGEVGISGKYLIVGHLPAGWRDLDDFEGNMKNAWGDHFVSLNDIKGDVLSSDFRENVAQLVYDKLEEMQYLEK